MEMRIIIRLNVKSIEIYRLKPQTYLASKNRDRRIITASQDSIPDLHPPPIKQYNFIVAMAAAVHSSSFSDQQKYMKARQALDVQLNENTMELERLEAAATVYKMIGPVLVKQEMTEAKDNVQKRIDYISGELKRHDGVIKDIEKKQDTQKETLQKLQSQFQQAQQRAAKS
ncbi:PFD6-like protein [Mya arenaria]|uniref:PFD6-like protein n=1 Tax=Mya arenaria TaxID=6604 RepID=A0ABY7G8N1_MYAAR|nr:PFD6-like protein [Mya arenaria]